MEVEELLLKAGLEYLKQCVIEEDGIKVTQVRFSAPPPPAPSGRVCCREIPLLTFTHRSCVCHPIRALL